MAQEDDTRQIFNHEDHQVAYIFDPDEAEPRQQRPAKRRRVSKPSKSSSSAYQQLEQPIFTPLLAGKERPELVQLRHDLFHQSWEKIESRINRALRESNSATLEQVASFVEGANAKSFDKIPAAFIITGSNIASQNLLFEQLSESLQRTSRSEFVRLRSSEATSLKVTLKKIIRDVTSRSAHENEDGVQVDGDQEVLKGYLDYDLEALHAFIKPQNCDHVFVAFEDSEGFDGNLFYDLLPLLNSWRPHIPFTLLFGIATSVDLLQARLAKSVSQQIYGAQFDAVQTGSILETVFKIAVAADDVPVRLGAPLLRSMLHRQRNHVAGVQAFVSSLKYAYMCHFYANGLSSLQAALKSTDRESKVQTEHLEAVRNLPSFRAFVESKIDNEDLESLNQAQSLLENDDALLSEIQQSQDTQQTWIRDALRALLIQDAAEPSDGDFSTAYVALLAEGASASENSRLVSSVQQLGAPALVAFLHRTIFILREGVDSLLSPASDEEGTVMGDALSQQLSDLEILQKSADEDGIVLRSSYSGHLKVTRTTVIAQRVQLSRGTATLSEQDKKFTFIVDEVLKILGTAIHVPPLGQVFLSESWTYDSISPSRDIFIPRPRPIFERSLGRPHDYLGCECCKDGSGGIQATLPATAILYQLYLETGSLINVADLWSAFHGTVGQEEEDERKVLVSFYRGLAEMRALGFVKASKKKADHIAKLKWL